MAEKKLKDIEKTDVSRNSIFILIQILALSVLGIFNSIFLIAGINLNYPFIGGEIYGRLAYIQNIVIIFTPFLYIGFLLTLTKKIAEHYAIHDEFSRQKVKYTIKFAYFTIGIVTLTFYFIFTFVLIPSLYQFDFLNVNMPFYFGLFGLTWIINFITVISTGVLQGFQKYRYVTISVSMGVLFNTIAYSFLLYTSNLNLLTVGIVLLISELLKGIIAFFYASIILKKYDIIDVKINLTSQQKTQERRELMKINVIFMFLNLFYIFIFYYDKVLIYSFLNSYTELAYYVIANYIFTFLFPLSCAIFNSLLPASSEQNILNNKASLVKYVKYGSKYALYISVILAIFMGTIFSQIMPIIYGELGQKSIIYLGFFAIILIFETLFSPLGNVLIGINVRNYALIYSIRAILNIILWPLLFNALRNVIGILVGSIISSFIWYLAGLIYLHEYIEVRNFLKLIPTVLLPSILIMGIYFSLLIFNFFTSTSLLISILKIGVFGLFISGIYVTIIALMKGFTLEDIRTIENGINFIPGSKAIISFLKRISRYS